jgi:hypothetical protein
VALGLGGLSLMAVSTLSGGVAGEDAEQMPEPTAAEPIPEEGLALASPASIVVNLQESADPEDVDDNAGADAAGDDAADEAADDASVVAPAQGPGSTAF